MVIELKWVVGVLGSALLLSILGIITLAVVAELHGSAVSIPDVLQNIAVGSLTALAGVLVPSTLSKPDERRRQP